MLKSIRAASLTAAAFASAAGAQTLGFATLPPGSILHAQASVIARVVQDHSKLQVRVIGYGGDAPILDAAAFGLARRYRHGGKGRAEKKAKRRLASRCAGQVFLKHHGFGGHRPVAVGLKLSRGLKTEPSPERDDLRVAAHHADANPVAGAPIPDVLLEQRVGPGADSLAAMPL